MTKRGMKPEQRDIVLIPIPFTDLRFSKKRPVLVVSNNSYNTKAEDVVVCAITSKILPERFYSQMITKDDLNKGILPLDSQIRADKIYCIHQKLILKKYGVLKEASFEKLTSLLISLVSLTEKKV